MDDPPANELPVVKVTIDDDEQRRHLAVGVGVDASGWASVSNESPFFNAAALGTKIVNLRQNLTKWAKLYDTLLLNKTEDPLTCDPGRIKEMWIELAQWGNGLYQELFHKDSADLVTWSQVLKSLKGRRLVIDSVIGGVPWGLLYDEEVPASPSDDYIAEMIDHFWLTSYRLEVLPEYPKARAGWLPQLNNREGTRLTVTVNEYIDQNDGSKQIEFFKAIRGDSLGLQTLRPLLPFEINKQKADVIRNITTKQEPQHLVYFFCHHKKGDGKWMSAGWRDFDESEMIVEGKVPSPKTTITLTEFRDAKIKSFTSPPVVFMNACESSQVEIDDPTSFMIYFINSLHACAFIGTEAQVPTRFADEFGKRFVKEFLSGKAIGEIMYNARRDYAKKHLNPFGLFYTQYGDGNVRLLN